MPFSTLDRPALARALAQVADRGEDIADIYFERLEELERPPEDEAPGVQVRVEQGFAVRLVRDGLTWLAARDGFVAADLAAALREVARALPRAAYPVPELAVVPPPALADPEGLSAFAAGIERRIGERHAGFPLRLRVRAHRRDLLVVGTRLVAGAETERWYSFEAETPWGRHGAVLADLDAAAAERLAEHLVAWFRARESPPPPRRREAVVLAPPAAAVLLHEAVAHALETDTLALGGRPEAAVGVTLGSELLNVLDDPGAAPAGVRRTTDDEGSPVMRRWLLKSGVVEQPLADLFAARHSTVLAPGAARRAGRFSPPAPRSTHLELLAGEGTLAALLADAEGGLFFPEAARGALDPLSGDFTLRLPFGYRIRGGAPAEGVGPTRLAGRVTDLLEGIAAVGGEPQPAGAGWCAKGGQRMPVWATAPAVRFEALEVGS